MPSGVISTRAPAQPKEFRIPSRSFGITAANAADILSEAEEIKANKPLWNAASRVLSGQILAKRQAQLDAATKASKPT